MYKSKPDRLPNVTPKHCTVKVRADKDPDKDLDWWFIEYETYRHLPNRTHVKVEWFPPPGSDFVFPDWMYEEFVRAGQAVEDGINIAVWNVIENVKPGPQTLDWGWVEPNPSNRFKEYETAHNAITRAKQDELRKNAANNVGATIKASLSAWQTFNDLFEVVKGDKK